MIRKSLPWNVKQVCNMIDKGTITFDNPIQRPAGQWREEDKSLLIHSLLTMFIPDIYAIQIKEEKGNTYSIVDGKQRLTIISSYLADQWTLTELDPIKLESTNESFNISNMKFSDLPESVQEEIKGYTITFKAIELEVDDDEENIVEDIFYRLNNGKAVSKEHLALVKADHNVQEFVRKMITDNKLFTEVAHFSETQTKKSDKEMTVLQSIALISGKPYNSFAAKDMEKFFIENTITEEILSKTEKAFTDISHTFQTYSKFCSKINISAMAYALANATTNKNQTMANLLHYVSISKPGDNYKRYTGAGCTKKENVIRRIESMCQICDVAVQNVAK